MPPLEPPPSPWAFPPADRAGSGDLLAVGADLEPGTLLAAYRAGVFPLPVEAGLLAWWSPARRGVLPLDGLRVSASLRRSLRRYTTSVNRAFDPVVDACAALPRPGGWISVPIQEAYRRLHRLGWAHSVEAWDAEGRLAGGLYGVALGGLFAGESMFHVARDASKVALTALVDAMSAADGGPEAAARAGRVLDVQWVTPHLASLGAVEVDRSSYQRLLARALKLPLPPVFAGTVAGGSPR